ncbi:MAG: HDOD domain-containing protein [Chitinivibrionales bacterium]
MDPSMANRIMSTLANVEYLSSTPDLSMKLLAKVKDEAASVDDIAEVILPSPALCASLLRLANSVYYSRGTVISTISHAIVHLGLDAVVNYVIALEMMNAFHSSLNQGGFNGTLFWKSSLAGALLAQELALKGEAEARNEDAGPETAFLSGLLRDIGVLVLRQYFPDIFMEVCDCISKKGLSFDQACKSVCSLDHRAIAFLLGTRWNLPAKILAVFQVPSVNCKDYQAVIRNRNIVLYADFLLKINKIFLWDVNAVPDSSIAVLTYLPAEEIEPVISRINTEVNEFFNII